MTADATILIEYGTVRCERSGGWLPALWRRGRESWGFGKGVDRERALLWARQWAREEAERYVGDWNVTVRERVDVA